jgi:hypothetical protein
MMDHGLFPNMTKAVPFALRPDWMALIKSMQGYPF